MSIQSEIAKVGQSPEFIVAMAHAWFACSVLLILSHWGLTLWIGAPVCVAIAGAKEFWFDLRYETLPRETVLDSALDFAEYMAGLALAVLIIAL